jgi:bacterioferritin-associated ferredoxin
VRELSRKTGLGTCCGKCVPEARATIAGCRAERDPTSCFSPAAFATA